MTVNERLYVAGLFDEFEKAVAEKNADIAIRFLKEVELTEPNINAILETLGVLSEDNA